MSLLTTVVILVVTTILPGGKPVRVQQQVENIGICWAFAREITARAEDTVIRNGGTIVAACNVIVQPNESH